MAKFKVGDRIIQPGWHERDTCTVVSISETRMTVRDDRGCTGSYTHLAPFVLVTPTITIEPGKHYRLRNGKVTGRISQGDIGFEALVDGQVKVFDKAGGAVFGGEDIVEAWVPKVGERVRLTANNRRYGKAGDVVTVIEVNNRDKDIYGQFDYEILGQLKWYVPWAILEPLLVAAPAQPEVWVPAVGDKVVWMEPFKASMYTKGKEYLINKKDSYGALYITDDNDNPNHTWRNDNILRSFSLAVPLKIEAGRYYKARDGRKVGPMETFLSDMFSVVIDGTSRIFQSDGTHGSEYVTKRPELDLIAEWVDEPVAVAASNDNVAKPKFKVGDRVVTSAGYTFDCSPGVIVAVNVNDDFDLYNVKIDDHHEAGGRAWSVRTKAITPIATTQPTAIVALIENGQPKPAERPFVHATEAAASKEAARLVGIHKGKQFGVYVLASTNQEAEPTYKHEWQRLAAKGEKINAIKELRSVTGMQLKPAKDVVEHFIDYPYGQLAA